MKIVFVILALVSTAASVSFACGEHERCSPSEEIPAIACPIKKSIHIGKKGIVCSVAGTRVQFKVSENSLDLKNLDTLKSERYGLSEYIVNRNGNEELSGGDRSASHTITISQMETAIALGIEIRRGYDFINTSLDSRLCR